MEPEHHIPFRPVCLDVTHGRLWRSDQVIGLRPRSLAVLHYLVAHPGRLVTKAELRGQVWAGTQVTELLRLAEPRCLTGRNLFPAGPCCGQQATALELRAAP